MRILLVLAHPLETSFTAAVAETARRALESGGHRVDLLDLHREGFDPRLSAAERGGYFDTPYDMSAVAGLVERLRAADGLVLVFPQWWFNFPAVLKGFFDRVLAPGVAFSHDPAGGRITPRLTNIKLLWALTSTGSPWWLVRLYMGDPVRRLLKRGIAACCAKGVAFRMLSLHDMDRATPAERAAHLERVRRAMARIGRSA
jgi:putative NADPH-quinone reductase